MNYNLSNYIIKKEREMKQVSMRSSKPTCLKDLFFFFYKPEKPTTIR